MSSDTEAQKACKTLLGNGANEAKWLSGIQTANGTKVDGSRNYGYLTCTVGDAKGQYAGEDIKVMDGAHFQSASQGEATESAESSAASAWNDKVGVGMLATAVNSGSGDEANRDLQNLVQQVGK